MRDTQAGDDSAASPGDEPSESTSESDDDTDRPGAAEMVPDAGEASRPGPDDPPDLRVDGGADGASSAPVFDDFEGTALDAARWSIKGFEGQQMPTATTANLDATHTHSGGKAVLVRDGFLQTTPPASTFYGRFYAWYEADPGSGHWMSIVALAPGQGRDTEVRYGGHYGILQANYYGNDDEVISDPKGYCAPTCDNGVAMPIGRWVCTEFYFGEDEMRLWLDGKEVDTLHVTEWRNQKAPWSPSYDRVRLGFHNFQGAAPNVWLDDVALDTVRVGCD